MIFSGSSILDEVNDSKKLSAVVREKLFYLIRRSAFSYGIGMVSNKRIDEINILRATFEAMRRAVSRLSVEPDFILIDGRDEPFENIMQKSIVKGDSLSYSVAAASVLAKVTRDKIMNFYDRIYPEYGFACNKGYATPDHIEAIRKYGRCAIHRKSFKLRFEKDAQLRFDI